MEYGNVKKIKIGDIRVSNRYREDFGDIESMAVSIERYGLINPVVIDKEYNLIMGERRYRAHVSLGKKEIDARFVDDISEDEKKELEMEENLQRKDFEWWEEVLGRKNLFDLKIQLYGKAKQKSGGGYSMEDFAAHLGVSVGTVSMDLQLARAIKMDPSLKECKNKSAAQKKVRRIETTEVVTALAEKVRERKKEGVDLCTLINGDSRMELKKLPSESADLVLMDPPYGVDIEHKDGQLGEESTFDDSSYAMTETLSSVLRECHRVLKEDRVLLCFFDIRSYQKLKTLLQECGFNINATPFIWLKGVPGIAPQPSWYSKSYEMLLHCQKGDREMFKKGEKNYYECEPVPPSQKIHQTQKPTRLLRYFVEQHTLPGELVIDPFAGSGSTLIVAQSCDRKAWGCELHKESFDRALVEMTRGREEEKNEFKAEEI